MTWRKALSRLTGVVGLWAGITAGAFAEPLPERMVPPLPTRVAAPPAGNGVAYLASRDLPSDYAEQEFLVTGTANIYGEDAERQLVLAQSNHSYTTRILVRYPKDRSRFSGTVVFDVLHPEQGSESMWGFGRDYIVRSGDAYIQVTTSREPRNSIGGPPSTPIVRIKAFDPVRYAGIDFTDSGLTWDIISQVGRLIKTDTPENPLRAYLPRQTVIGGWSGAGALTLFYVNEGFANRARLPDGKPIFDAYLVGEPSWYPRVNSSVTPAQDRPDLDPRQIVQPRDVPAISLYSMSFAGLPDRPGMRNGRVRADSDAPDDRYRLWVVAGASHAGRLAGMLGGMGHCPETPSTLPVDHYFALTIDYLKKWAAGAVTPPHAAPLGLLPDTQPEYDVLGNPLGGLRSTWVDVPVARYFASSGSSICVAMGAEEPLSPDLIKALYGNSETYVAKVSARADQLVAEGWLLQEDAATVVREARAFPFPQ